MSIAKRCGRWQGTPNAASGMLIEFLSCDSDYAMSGKDQKNKSPDCLNFSASESSLETWLLVWRETPHKS